MSTLLCKNCGAPIVEKQFQNHKWWSHVGSSDYCRSMKAEPPALPEPRK